MNHNIEQFRADVKTAINKNCIESGSNTPDFILSDYLVNCLLAYERIHQANESWYGKKLEVC